MPHYLLLTAMTYHLATGIRAKLCSSVCRVLLQRDFKSPIPYILQIYENSILRHSHAIYGNSLACNQVLPMLPIADLWASIATG